VPAVFNFELANIARSKIRLRPADKPEFEASLQDAFAYPISVDAVNFLEVVRLAIDTKLSASDASYLWLARRLDVPLETLYKKLAAHATRH
jgi:predicted nucleic acid-binding protein